MNMLYSFVILAGLHFVAAGDDRISFILEPEWRFFPQHFSSHHTFHDQWILYARIIIKKKSCRPAFLSRLVLPWNGLYMSVISASLYENKYPSCEEFYPTQSKFIADGRWSAVKQEFSFNFHNPLRLALCTTYYLVISASTSLIKSLREGALSINYDQSHIFFDSD